MFTIRNLKHITLAAVAVAATLGVGSAWAGISDTKHNLSSTGAAGNNKVGETTEICVFCHTPHGSDATAAAPLWNKNISSPPSYTTYSSTTLDTSATVSLAAGSVSAACLSCHDGTQAMDTMINEPGSGADTVASWTWSGANQDGTGKMIGLANLGTNLNNDHPVGMEYAKYGSTVWDADFVTASVVSGKEVWYVETTTPGSPAKDKNDMILYSRGTAGSKTPFVECASCHDPHTSDNPTFLRVANTNSAVCLACHTK